MTPRTSNALTLALTFAAVAGVAAPYAYQQHAEKARAGAEAARQAAAFQKACADSTEIELLAGGGGDFPIKLNRPLTAFRRDPKACPADMPWRGDFTGYYAVDRDGSPAEGFSCRDGSGRYGVIRFTR